MPRVTGSCQQCHRKRPQLYVLVEGVRKNVCPNCAFILEREHGARLEHEQPEHRTDDAQPVV